MKTKYEDKRLAELSNAQVQCIQRVDGEIITLAVTGVAKVIAKKKVYLINRSGKVTYQGRRGWISS